MKKPLITLFILITILLLSGCAIRTPQINGLVLDEETKQPVPEAWISASIEVETATVAGDVTSYISIDQPHTRTDQDGKFIIPSRIIWSAFSPYEFGSRVNNFGVSASTSDYKGGSIKLKNKMISWFDVDVSIYIDSLYKNDNKKIADYMKNGITKEKAVELLENEQFSSIRALENYCTSGRFSVEIPIVEGGCDDWELDYAIKKHEIYLERYGVNSKNAGEVFSQLGYLYKIKKNYSKALEYFKMSLEYNKKRKFGFGIYTIKNRIKELEKLINENSIK